ncbi:DUF1549 domain-containing protein [Roseiconus nitratireducens]|uniref:DUF1549 domain-containing protein n=1 Tax=Roseiconus nitratireducens TaxID=2605748 RepID=UPI001F22E1DF|nr:DUF1549 domain-containing protein [Roseiconus nitratireducens]
MPRGIAGDPTTQINSQLSAAWQERKVQPAERCDDRTFVRRVYLDLAGRIPTREESRTFLADPRDDRRQTLVERLLGSEDHAQHFADLFDVILMGRADEGTYQRRARHGWRAFLETAFRENRPWDEVARQILIARPSDKEHDGAVWFLYEREDNYQAIAEAVAPAFFGIRIECAQCHDHMMADEIEQAHYWGLVAFFNRGKNEDTPNGPRVAESAVGGFSEFANLEGSSTPNFLTFLDAGTVAEERPAKEVKRSDEDRLYVSAEVPGDPREPIFSRRQKFVTQVLDGHPLLARAMVNRVWAILMARGIVHPHDEIDSMHPPSHPDLLDWLSDDFAASGFDVRRLVRSIVLSDAYQLSARRPTQATPPDSFAWYLERPLTAEQLARSIQLVLRGSFQNDASVVEDLRQQILEVLPDTVEVPIGDALFFSNHANLDAFIRASDGDDQLIAGVLACETADERAERLIETAFGRSPTESETSAITAYLDQRSERPEEAVAQIVWSLITSAEFRFNH